MTMTGVFSVVMVMIVIWLIVETGVTTWFVWMVVRHAYSFPPCLLILRRRKSRAICSYRTKAYPVPEMYFKSLVAFRLPDLFSPLAWAGKTVELTCALPLAGRTALH